jgi:hypothetical protein
MLSRVLSTLHIATVGCCQNTVKLHCCKHCAVVSVHTTRKCRDFSAREMHMKSPLYYYSSSILLFTDPGHVLFLRILYPIQTRPQK